MVALSRRSVRPALIGRMGLVILSLRRLTPDLNFFLVPGDDMAESNRATEQENVAISKCKGCETVCEYERDRSG